MSVKTVVTVCCTVLAVGITAALAYQARFTLTLILAAGVVAIALHRGVDFLRRHKIKRRPLAIAIVLTGFFGVLVGFALIIIPTAVSQGKELVDQAPQALQTVRHSRVYAEIDRRVHIDKRLNELDTGTGQMVAGAVNPVLKAVGGIVTVLATTVTFLFMVVFLLVFAEGLVKKVLAESTAARRARYERVLARLYQSVGGYLTGLSLIGTVNGTCSTIFLAISGMPYFLPLGILSGFSSLVPYIGPTIAGTLITGTAFATGGMWRGIATAIYFVIYGQLEGNILAPLVFRKTVDVNPLMTLLSILIAAEIGGAPGAVLAVPLFASFQIVVQELLRMRRKRLEVPLQGDVAAAQRAHGEVAAPESPH